MLPYKIETYPTMLRQLEQLKTELEVEIAKNIAAVDAVDEQRPVEDARVMMRKAEIHVREER